MKKQTNGTTTDRQNQKRDRSGELPAIIALTAAFGVLVLLNIFFGDHWLDSDMAAEMIFSRLLAQEGGFLATSSWYYSTEFRVLYTQVFMEPLFLVCKSWHMVRLVTNVLTYLTLLCSYFYMMKPLKIKRSTVIWISVLLLLPFSETFITHVQMGNTYMPHMILIFFGFGMYLRLTQSSRGIKALGGCYLLLCVVCGLSGVRYLLALQGPLVLTAAVYLMKSGEFAMWRRCTTREKAKKVFSGERLIFLGWSLAGALCALAGYGLNVILVARKYDFQTYEATNFISIYQGIFLERVQNTLGSLLMLLGYIPDKGFLSLRGVITMTSFVLLAGMVFLAVRSGRLLKAEGEKKEEFSRRRFVLWFFVTAFLINTFVFVFTTSTIVPRYYLTVWMFALPVLAVYLQEERQTLDRSLVVLVLCLCMSLATLKTVYSFISTDKNGDKRAVASFLKEEGYTFGYATYWNANIMTELTDGAVEIANIHDLAELDYFKWSSPRSYYEEGYHNGETFLLLTAQELEEYGREPVVREGRAVYQDEYYTVLHFESVDAFQKYR